MRGSKALLFSTLVLMVSPLLFAQQPPADQSQGMQMPAGQKMQMPAGQKMQMPMPAATDSGAMPEMNCQAMMDEMQASQKAMDDRLGALVDSMNKAKGSAKVDRMAAVINEMVVQRKQMRDDMAAMMPQMMNHMMQHMQAGMMSGMKSMMACPMMKGGTQDVGNAPMVHK